MRKEIPRKTIHMLFGTIFIAMIYYLGSSVSLAILSLIFVAGFILSIVIKYGYNVFFLVNVIRAVERDYEKHWPGKAALLFFIAAIILLYFFGDNPSIAMAGIATAVYGDALAALVGKGFGKIKIGFNNTLEGTLACLLTCIFCIGFFFPFPHNSFILVFVPALVATIAEYLPINDNIAMPLGASTALYFLLLLAL